MKKQITDFDTIDYALVQKGLSEEIVRQISAKYEEPSWMLSIRLSALKAFYELPLPAWGPDLSGLNLDNIRTFAQVDDSRASTQWADVPSEIKSTFEALGIPEAERRYLG